jgi:primosomal protein N' (replication factor Y) (superfamily II helicase)
MPDFRAGERVFQLLTQVAGRAGRGQVEGEVLVQTYTPHHPAIQFARRMDFEGFCDQELAFRKELFYPPFSHLACITLRGKDEGRVEQTTDQLFQTLESCVASNVMLSPPVPAPISRVRGEYRWQILLRAEKTGDIVRPLRRAVSAIKKWPKGVRCTIDIDASSLL